MKWDKKERNSCWGKYYTKYFWYDGEGTVMRWNTVKIIFISPCWLRLKLRFLEIYGGLKSNLDEVHFLKGAIGGGLYYINFGFTFCFVIRLLHIDINIPIFKLPHKYPRENINHA